MKDFHPVDRARGVEVGDFFALGVRARIAFGSHDDDDGGVVGPRHLGVFERPRGGGEKERRQVARESRHQNLALGLNESDVLLQKFHRAILGDHQSGENDTRERAPFGSHAVHRRLDDVSHHHVRDLGRDDGSGRVRTHTTRVQAGVAVAHALVVLRARQRHGFAAADDGEKGRLLAVQKLLHDDFLAGAAEHGARKHIIDRVQRVFDLHGHDHALTRG